MAERPFSDAVSSSSRSDTVRIEAGGLQCRSGHSHATELRDIHVHKAAD